MADTAFLDGCDGCSVTGRSRARIRTNAEHLSNPSKADGGASDLPAIDDLVDAWLDGPAPKRAQSGTVSPTARSAAAKPRAMDAEADRPDCIAAAPATANVARATPLRMTTHVMPTSARPHGVQAHASERDQRQRAEDHQVEDHEAATPGSLGGSIPPPVAGRAVVVDVPGRGIVLALYNGETCVAELAIGPHMALDIGSELLLAARRRFGRDLPRSVEQ